MALKAIIFNEFWHCYMFFKGAPIGNRCKLIRIIEKTNYLE